MDKIINIAEGIFCICGSVWATLYYFGHLNYSGKKEQRRKERAEKYGRLLIIGIVLMSLGGVSLIFSNI